MRGRDDAGADERWRKHSREAHQDGPEAEDNNRFGDIAVVDEDAGVCSVALVTEDAGTPFVEPLD